jgi:hypothetical protein
MTMDGAIESMTSQPKSQIGQHRPSKGQLFKLSQFLYVIEGRSFTIQVQESPRGVLTAHAESTSDPHEAIRPISGSDLKEVLQSLTNDIDQKVSKW